MLAGLPYGLLGVLDDSGGSEDQENAKAGENLYSDAYLSSIIEKLENENASDDAMVNLINELAYSGNVLNWTNCVFDFASTGGPSSLTTLLVPLFLYGLGVGVINLAVEGRPAGAIDVLSQIEGYNLNCVQRKTEFRYPFYVHLAANESFAPLDKALFEYRKRVGKVDVPNLAIASLISKKIASGADNIGLDIRISEFGNFGKSWSQCANNAKKFNRVASVFGINSTCFLSDANNPYQRYIGRGEALEALYALLEGTEDVQLLSHKDYCWDIACYLVEKTGRAVKNKNVELKRCFQENLAFQGSKYNAFLDAVQQVKKQARHSVCADEDGYIRYDLKKIRDYIVSRQQELTGKENYPDPCGITLLCGTGDYVSCGTPVISVRNYRKEDAHMFYGMYSVQKELPYISTEKRII